MDGSRHDRRAGYPSDGSAGPSSSRKAGFFHDLGRFARATGALLRDHALLAREEAKQEGKKMAVNASMGVAALPFALTALIMLSVALAVALSGWLGVGWAFLVVGLLDLAIAGVLGVFAALRMKEEPKRALSQTKAELEEDKRHARRLFQRIKAPPSRAAISSHGNSHAERLGGGVHVGDYPPPQPTPTPEAPVERRPEQP